MTELYEMRRVEESLLLAPRIKTCNKLVDGPQTPSCDQVLGRTLTVVQHAHLGDEKTKAAGLAVAHSHEGGIRDIRIRVPCLQVQFPSYRTRGAHFPLCSDII